MKPWILPLRIAALALPAFLALPLCAYMVAPSLVSLRSVGSDSSTFFRLENREPKPVAIEITIHEHRKDLDGNTINGAPADDDFIVYPAQLVMVPGDEVGVQVRWIGEPALASERTYTLVTREVPIPRPIDEPATNTGIRVDVTVLVNYEGRIYVTPPGARPSLAVETISDLASEQGASPAAPPQLEVILANQGTAHQVLSDLSFVLVPLDASGAMLRQQAVTIAARDVPGTRPHLLAGERRRLRIPRPAGLPAGPVRLMLSP